MEAGDVFRATEPYRHVEQHFWVVLSDTKAYPKEVVIVSGTSNKPGRESTCLLGVGEHPWVRHSTCVAYKFAQVTTLLNLREGLYNGTLEKSPDPLAAHVLARIRDCSGDSPFLPDGVAEVLIAQNIIRLDE